MACRQQNKNPATTGSITITLTQFYAYLKQLGIKITDNMQRSLAWGCIGFASWMQSPDRGVPKFSTRK